MDEEERKMKVFKMNGGEIKKEDDLEIIIEEVIKKKKNVGDNSEGNEKIGKRLIRMVERIEEKREVLNIEKKLIVKEEGELKIREIRIEGMKLKNGGKEWRERKGFFKDKRNFDKCILYVRCKKNKKMRKRR